MESVSCRFKLILAIGIDLGIDLLHQLACECTNLFVDEVALVFLYHVSFRNGSAQILEFKPSLTDLQNPKVPLKHLVYRARD